MFLYFQSLALELVLNSPTLAFSHKVHYTSAMGLQNLATVLSLVFLAACSRSNNLLLGRVESKVGAHRVVVTDCYRTSVPAPEQISAGIYRYEPCRDAELWIRHEELVVNGRSYGRIGPADAVLVDHGVVSVERK